MYPILFHIYGPFSINSFSLAIAIGIGLFTYKAVKNLNKVIGIEKNQFINMVMQGSILALIGGRVLFVLEEWKSYENLWQMIAIWNKGCSSLGCVITAIIYVIWFIKKNKIKTESLIDVIGLYAPIIHIWTRIGCFLAGCCFGKPTDLPWGVTYTNSECIAPLNIQLHPVQIYDILAYIFIYLILKNISKRNYMPGQLGFAYLFLSNITRFSMDFIRGDRIINYDNALIKTELFSFDQFIALSLATTALFGIVYIYKKNSQVRLYESI